MSAELVAAVRGLDRAMPGSVFFNLADSRKKKYAGHGFLHMGKGNDDIGYAGINEGMYTGGEVKLKSIWLNRNGSLNKGNSLTTYPTVIVDGIKIHVTSGIASGNSNQIKFPDAPDGMQNPNGTVHANITAARSSGGNDLNNSVITRQDFVFLEVWHEKVMPSSRLFPFGNVQFKEAVWAGISLNNTGMPQGYSAHGPWDTTTKGYGVDPRYLSHAEFNEYLDDPRHNIYIDDGVLIQVRYRIRVVKGLSNDVQHPVHGNGHWQTEAAGRLHIHSQGQYTVSGDYNESYYFTNMHAECNGEAEVILGTPGCAVASSYQGDGRYLLERHGHKGLCYALPIAKVQRRNKGMYHPTYNPFGCASKARANTGSPVINSHVYWSDAAQDGINPVSIYDTFVSRSSGDGILSGYHSGTGYIGAPTNGRFDGKAYDEIHESDILDLRMSCRVIDEEAKRDEYIQKAIRSEIRGWEGIVKTTFSSNTITITSTWKFKEHTQRLRVYTSASTAPRNRTNHEFENTDDSNDFYILYGSNGNVAQLPRINPGDNTGINWPWRDNVAYIYYTTDIVSELNSKFPPGTELWLGVTTKETSYKSAKPEILEAHCVPSVFAATFPDGFYGRWSRNSDNSVNWELTRKWEKGLRLSRSDDNGTTWSRYSWGGGSMSNSNVNFAKNISPITTDNFQISISSYLTRADFTRPCDDGVPFSMGKPFATSCGNLNLDAGQILTHSLTKMILKGNINNLTMNPKLLSKGIKRGTGEVFTSTAYGINTNSVIDLDVSNDTDGIKTLDYLTNTTDNISYKLNVVYKVLKWDYTNDSQDEFIEVSGTGSISSSIVGRIYFVNSGRWGGYWRCLVSVTEGFDNGTWVKLGNKLYSYDFLAKWEQWDGNGWADDDQFPTGVDGTVVDESGVDVKYGTHEISLPYFIKKKTN